MRNDKIDDFTTVVMLFIVMIGCAYLAVMLVVGTHFVLKFW